ncbi:MAG: thioredoxin family protein, partial [Pirellulaceae bacterium]|nr:thioredoxin family protein [Pirellulaceae bacterium]
RADKAHVEFSAHVEPAEVKAGGEATLVITTKLDKPFHIYKYVPGSDETQYRTLIVPTKKGVVKWGEPLTDAKVHTNNDLGFAVEYHAGEVQWKIPLRVPADTPEGPQELELVMGYMTCTDESCDPPAGLVASGVLNVVKSPGATPLAALTIQEAKSNLAAKQENLATWIDFKADIKGKGDVAAGGAKSTDTQATGGLETGRLSAMTMLFALMGGFILNFMPCVLPVIGLKVLGFVEQAGSSRGEVIKLNLAYVFGICSVMWVLAGITVATSNTFGWGDQFTKFEFKLAMAALVFAMALSFLGVWEIPIPGFATSYKSNQLMQREGVFGAFSKGLFTTILATPCSGPFLGFVFAVTVTLDPVGVFVVYTLVGLGMGLPFLLLCFQPQAVKMLPKPGAWMETLKEALSFPLLLTVVYFVASIGSDYRIATFSTLIAVWFGCWLIGKVPIYADRHVKVKAWSAALATIALWGMLSFSWLGPIKTDMPWEAFSNQRLAALRGEGKTVMIDFTANWCLNCQANSRLAIEVPNVIKLVKANGVAPLLADKTEPSPEIDAKLRELGASAIPFLVVYPADPQADPIILNGTFTQDKLIAALKKAGPSRNGAAANVASRRPANLR